MTEELDTDSSPEEEKEKPKPFDEEQIQWLGSWMGRKVKDGVGEGMEGIKDHISEALSQSPQPVSNELIEKFNKDIFDQIMDGDPVGAFEKMGRVQTRAQKNLSKAQTTDMKKSITSYSDDPLYKDIYPEIESFAKDAVRQGYPPDAAAKMGFYQAKSDFQEKRATSSHDPSDLEMSGGGRSTPRKSKTKLPLEFKEAASRDIAKGLFKDEQEYMDNMTPAIKAKYGI